MQQDPPPPFPLRYRDRPTRTEIKHREKQSKRNGYTDIYQRVNIESVALPVSVPSLASSFPSISIYLHISFLLFSNILFSQEFIPFFPLSSLQWPDDWINNFLKCKSHCEKGNLTLIATPIKGCLEVNLRHLNLHQALFKIYFQVMPAQW